MCDQAVGTCLSTIILLCECYKNHQMRDKAVHRCFFEFIIFFLIGIKLKKYVTKLFLKILLLIPSCPDKYITQRMCDEAIDNSLAALKVILDWFVTSKMSKKLYTTLCPDKNLLGFNEDFGDAHFLLWWNGYSQYKS